MIVELYDDDGGEVSNPSLWSQRGSSDDAARNLWTSAQGCETYTTASNCDDDDHDHQLHDDHHHQPSSPSTMTAKRWGWWSNREVRRARPQANGFLTTATRCGGEGSLTNLTFPSSSSSSSSSSTTSPTSSSPSCTTYHHQTAVCWKIWNHSRGRNLDLFKKIFSSTLFQSPQTITIWCFE